MNLHKFFRRLARWENLPLLLTVFFGLCYATVSLSLPLIGDDIDHSTLYNTKRTFPLLRTLYTVWVCVNGRLGDALSFIWMPNVPRPVTALLVGSAVATLPLLISKLGNVSKENFTLRTTIVAATVFTLPWWDSIILFACQFNYVLASVLALLVCYLILNRRISERTIYLLLPVAFLAGGMHEASGLPMTAGLVIFHFINRKSNPLSKARKVMLAAFCIGACYTLSSPAPWHRIQTVVMDDPAWLLVIKNSFFSIILVIAVAIRIMRRNGELQRLLADSITVFIIASIGSAFFSVIGGIIGRSGWFAQTTAIVALLRLITHDFPKMRALKPVSMLLAAAVVGHMSLFVVTQENLSKEISAIHEGYVASTDGIVFCDTPHSDNLPALTLGKNFGAYPQYDYYSYSVMHHFLSDYKKPFPVVLPTEARPHLRHTVASDIRIGDCIISPTEPTGSNVDVFHPLDTAPYYRVINTGNDGERLIAQPFDNNGQTLWCIRPIHLLWGYRVHTESAR